MYRNEQQDVPPMPIHLPPAPRSDPSVRMPVAHEPVHQTNLPPPAVLPLAPAQSPPARTTPLSLSRSARSSGDGEVWVEEVEYDTDEGEDLDYEIDDLDAEEELDIFNIYGSDRYSV
ncbi:hypothetical protein HK097_010110, partial [Rhizophlyctis rosea]